jgi:hypothetical protein
VVEVGAVERVVAKIADHGLVIGGVQLVDDLPAPDSGARVFCTSSWTS